MKAKINEIDKVKNEAAYDMIQRAAGIIEDATSYLPKNGCQNEKLYAALDAIAEVADDLYERF